MIKMAVTLFNGSIAETASTLTRQTVAVKSYYEDTETEGFPVPRMAAGTGIIISGSGYVVTNAHVVAGSSQIRITTPDNKTHLARVVGYDTATDLALIRIMTKGLSLSAVDFGDSSAIRPGDPVIAVGNALGLPGGPTVSLGVVSAVQRQIPMSEFIFEGLIQTDAAINPGNSGGPLATLDGKVIGMNTAMIPMAQGMGFAIPSNTIRELVAKIMEDGKIIRPWIGITGSDAHVGVDQGAVLVASVAYGSPAHQAGVRRGDLILKFNGKDTPDMRTLTRLINDNGIGKAAEMNIRRGERKGVLQIIPGESPGL